MKKIAIVGTAPSSVNDAPYNDQSWEIWSLGANYGAIRRFNRWFELHTPDALFQAKALQPDRIQFLQRIGKDLTIGFPDPIWPEAVVYPKDEVIKYFTPEGQKPYFTSSIAWMIALAIYEKATEIGIWGVDMIGDGEYSHQRGCCEYLLGCARFSGITLTLSPKSPLLRAERMYAFEYTNLAGETQAKIEKANLALMRATEEHMRAIEDKGYYKGVLHTLHEYERRYG